VIFFTSRHLFSRFSLLSQPLFFPKMSVRTSCSCSSHVAVSFQTVEKDEVTSLLIDHPVPPPFPPFFFFFSCDRGWKTDCRTYTSYINLSRGSLLIERGGTCEKWLSPSFGFPLTLLELRGSRGRARSSPLPLRSRRQSVHTIYITF